MSEPLAHVDESGRSHALCDHLESVGAIAGGIAAAFGTGQWGRLAGIWHDLGKFRGGFQDYIRRSSDPDAHIEGKLPPRSDRTHSAAGALHAIHSFVERFGRGAEAPARALAYVIAGHHAGLADWHEGLDPRLFGGGTPDAEREYAEALQECQRTHAEVLQLPDDFKLRDACKAIPGIADGNAEPLALSLWVRMLFSSLVDADFLDTEAFYDETRRGQRAGFPPLHWYRERLSEHLDTLTARVKAEGRSEDVVMRARAQVLSACYGKASLPPGVFSLSVPTGGGKTFSSLAFALAHAAAHGLNRVVVAIPYTSIVEQTVDEFAKVFGRANVVEHHSQADAADDRGETARSRLACENWDAPLVVTTNVQLLESMFARRTSRCRKLHNLVRSVIVLDEAQVLPPPFLQPILDALRLLVRYYGSSLVLCTATQPVLTDIRRFDPRQNLRGLPPPVPIVDAAAQLYAALERVRFEWPVDWQAIQEVPDVAARVAAEECVLAIVNTRADAAELVAAVDSVACDKDGAKTLHLSAAMCGQHRADLIKQMRERLEARRLSGDTSPLRVVSTQLVEAGVDIDFPVVYRALAGLDSIAQAAGRCNREGRLGPRGGRVFVFVRPIPGPLSALRAGAQATISALAQGAPAMLAPDHFERYFPLYYANFESRDEKRIIDHLRSNADFAFDFRTAADKFRLVDDENQVALIVPYVGLSSPTGESSPVMPHVRAIDGGQVERWRMRALQRYIVNVRRGELSAAEAHGDVRELLPGLFLLVDTARYDLRLGLLRDGSPISATTLVQ